MYQFFSNKNMVMICRSGRHRSVANAELLSNTLTRCARRQHSVSLLHLSELDFLVNMCAVNCSEYSKQSLRVLQAHYEQLQAECLRRVPVLDPVTSLWKRPRPEHTEGVPRNQPRTRLMRKVIFHELREREQQMPLLYLKRRTQSPTSRRTGRATRKLS